MGIARIALISLEPWDAVWRRNQHLSAQLVRQELVSSLLFVEPPLPGPRPLAPPTDVPPGITVLRPRLRLPKRAGGLRLTGAGLRRGALRDVDVIWVNDAAFGVHCLSSRTRAVYDVTDDWRTFAFPPRIVRRIVRAEDRLAALAATVVCSGWLRDRWQERYGVDAAVVHNGIDAEAWSRVVPATPAGAGPHVGYVGTLHTERLDVELVLAVADLPAVGTLHLVGPDSLDEGSRQRLRSHPNIRLHGPVPAAEVPGVTAGMDLLISPHRLTPFTASLDAIKSREYLASGVPVVATPTSGFELLADLPGVDVVAAGSFPQQVVTALARTGPDYPRDLSGMTWAARAQDFARAWEGEPHASLVG